MEAQRVIKQVGSDGQLFLNLQQYRGMNVEVIILPAEEGDASNVQLAEIQMQSGFVQDVLANPEEDVWNDL